MVRIKLPLLLNPIKWLAATVTPDHDIAPPCTFLETPDANLDELECCGDSDASIDCEDTALRHFNAVLQQAQQVAIQAQRDKDAARKRPRRYDKKSKSTLYRQKKAREDLASKGFLPLDEFMTQMQQRKVQDQAQSHGGTRDISMLSVAASRAQTRLRQEEEEESDEERCVAAAVTP
jgi:hypothetical protein